jgi:hypothetical protein
MVQSHAPKLNAVPVDLADLNVFSSTSHACRGEDIGTRRLLTPGDLQNVTSLLPASLLFCGRTRTLTLIFSSACAICCVRDMIETENLFLVGISHYWSGRARTPANEAHNEAASIVTSVARA